MAKKRNIPDPRSDELIASIKLEMNLPRLAQSVRSFGKDRKVVVPAATERPTEGRRDGRP
jgi:hypothetical protein